MKTSDNQPGEKRRCRECGMALNPAQVVCTFCGESNPLPAGVAGGQSDLEFDVKPPSSGTAPMKPLHDSSTTASTAMVVQRRDPICPKCGKDNSKIPNARFCFSCGTTLTPLQQGTVETTPSPTRRYCPYCGKEQSRQVKAARFCLYCGKPMAVQAATTAPASPPGGVEGGEAAAPPQQPLPLHAVQSPTSTREEAHAPRPVPKSTAQPIPGTPAQPIPGTPAQPRSDTPAQPRSDTAAQPRPDTNARPAYAMSMRSAPAPVTPAKPPVERIDMLNMVGRYEAPVLSAAFSKDGADFYVGTANNEFIARETTNARARRIIQGERTGKVITVLAGRDGGGFATCMSGVVMRFTKVAVADPIKGDFTTAIRTPQSAILSVAVNQDRSLLLLGGYDKNAEIWDLKTAKLAFTLAGHADAIDAVTFDPTGKLAATGSRDGAVKVWKVENGELLRNLSGHTKPVLSLTFSPDCTRLASGSEDGSIKIWDPEKDSAVSTLMGHRGGVFALAFNNDGKRLVSGGQDTVAHVWDLEAAKEIRVVDVHTGAINAIAISPDGKRVITGGADKRSYHWALETGKK